MADELHGTPSIGLITNVDLPGAMSGWDIAQVVRDYNPHAAVGYLSMSGHRDWAMLGVPNSIIISGTSGEYEIPEIFFGACETDAARDGAEADLVPEWQRLDDIVRREHSGLHSHFQNTPIPSSSSRSS